MKQLSMYINGRFETDFNGTWRDVLNPATEEVIAREPKGGKPMLIVPLPRPEMRKLHGSVCLPLNAAHTCAKSPKASANVPTS